MRINPPRDYVAVDLSSVDYTSSNGFQHIWVGTTGNVNVLKADGSSVVIPNVPAGVWSAFQGKGILRSNTTAGGILVSFS